MLLVLPEVLRVLPAPLALPVPLLLLLLPLMAMQPLTYQSLPQLPLIRVLQN